MGIDNGGGRLTVGVGGWDRGEQWGKDGATVIEQQLKIYNK